MRGFYSISSRVRRGRPPRGDGPQVDPYSSAAANYAERTRETVTEIAPGMIRIDIGTPIAETGRIAPVMPTPSPPETTDAPQALSAGQPAPRKERSWKDDYGVSRNP